MPFIQTSNIQVDRVNSYGSKIVLVTFAERKSHSFGFGDKGWGEEFASSHRIDGFYVKAAGNDWYQYPEMQSTLGRIRDAVGNREVVTYGCSMGAYAAVKFAKPLGAKRSIAISPIFSPDPFKPPYDQRWKTDVDRTMLIDDHMEHSDEFELFVLADSTHPDAKHAKLFRQTFQKTTVISLPFSSHPVGPFLREAGLLRELTLSLFFGNFENSSFCLARRNQRLTSQIYRARRDELLLKRNKFAELPRA